MGDMYKETGTFTPDKLIADNAMTVTAKGIKIASEQGKLKRGTLLGIAADGTYKQTDTTETVSNETKTIGADCILTDDVDATSAAVISTAYVTGTFNAAAIIVPTGKTVASHETDLRKLGIFLKSVQEY